MAYILIVEDNEMNRDMLGRRLERRGFEIDFALDGQEGLDKIEGKKTRFSSNGYGFACIRWLASNDTS